MTRKEFTIQFGIDPTTLSWQTGWNGMFQYAAEDFGLYSVYHDSAWDYYVVRNSSVVTCRVDLLACLRKEA